MGSTGDPSGTAAATPAAGTDAPILQLAGVSVGYGRQQVVSDVDLAVGHGEIVAIIGHNGAGKSTLLKGIAGLAKVFSGSISLTSDDIVGLRPHQILKRGASFVGQGQDLFVKMSVEENVRMGGHLLPAKERNRRLAHCMSMFDVLGEKRKLRAGALSGGERQQIKLARSLMTEPRLLLLDEPSAGLSPKLVKEAFESLLRLRTDADVSLLLVEQNVRAAVDVADRIVVMQAGRVTAVVARSDLGTRVTLEDLLLGGHEAAHPDGTWPGAAPGEEVGVE